MTTLALPRCSARAGRTLLLVEQNSLLVRSFERYFRLYFDEVRVASDAAAAIAALQFSRTLTDVLCGSLKRGGESELIEWLEQWRYTLPALRRVLVVTSRDRAIALVPAVDAIIKKPVAPEALVSCFF